MAQYRHRQLCVALGSEHQGCGRHDYCGQFQRLSGTERKTTWDHIDYRAIIEYDITPDSMVYGSVSTGFKNYYDPEYLLSYGATLTARF